MKKIKLREPHTYVREEVICVPDDFEVKKVWENWGTIYVEAIDGRCETVQPDFNKPMGFSWNRHIVGKASAHSDDGTLLAEEMPRSNSLSASCAYYLNSNDY